MGLGGTRTASIQTLYSHLYFVFIQILFSIYSIIIPIILYYFGVFQFFYRHFRDLINAELPKIKAKSFKIQKIHCHIKKNRFTMYIIACSPLLLGTAKISGLLPILRSIPPHAGMFGQVLDQQIPIQPWSAACQP